MSAWPSRLTGVGLLILLGIAVETWTATSCFRPLLDAQQNQIASCKAVRDNLYGLAVEQGKALGDLMLAANERQAQAELAVKGPQASAQADYAVANRLQHRAHLRGPVVCCSLDYRHGAWIMRLVLSLRTYRSGAGIFLAARRLNRGITCRSGAVLALALSGCSGHVEPQVQYVRGEVPVQVHRHGLLPVCARPTVWK